MDTSKYAKPMKYVITTVNVALLALTVLGVIKTVFVGFDVDEGYAVAQAYRMVMGDNMFSEMWEPHQMSAFGLAIFIMPYLLITGGKTVGIVLYLRIVGTVIHLLLGWWFYKVAKKKFGTTIALFTAFAHINFLPKWLVLAEFEIMQYWAVCILFLAFLSFYEVSLLKVNKAGAGEIGSKSMFWKWRKEDGYLLAGGAALFMAMMTYPTMAILYPVYGIALLVLGGPKLKDRVRSVCIFTMTTFLIGVVFLLYLRTYMTVDDFIRYVSYIFMDESHVISFSRKIAIYGGELGHFIKQMFLYSPAAVAGTVIIMVAEIIRKKVRMSKEKTGTVDDSGDVSLVKQGFGAKVKKYVLIFMLLWLGIYTGKHILLSLIGDKNQFFLYFRYMVAVVVAVAGFAFCRKQNRVYMWLGVLPGIVGVIASAMVTNMSLEVAMARIYIGVIAGIFIICTTLKEKYGKDLWLKFTAYSVGVSFLVGLIICKLLLVRVTGCIPVTLRMDMDLIKEGPAAGLITDAKLAQQYNANIPFIEDELDEKDKLLYFGCENIYYLVSEARLSTPSVQGTTVFNELFTEYYKEHPDRIPDVVIIDKNFATNPYYNYSPQNQYMVEWIDEHFENADKTENEYLIILKK